MINRRGTSKIKIGNEIEIENKKFSERIEVLCKRVE